MSRIGFTSRQKTHTQILFVVLTIIKPRRKNYAFFIEFFVVVKLLIGKILFFKLASWSFQKRFFSTFLRLIKRLSLIIYLSVSKLF